MKPIYDPRRENVWSASVISRSSNTGRYPTGRSEFRQVRARHSSLSVKRLAVTKGRLRSCSCMVVLVTAPCGWERFAPSLHISTFTSST